MNWYIKNIKISSNINLWLDDERNPQDPFIQKNFGSKGDEVWVKTVEEAIPYINQNNVQHISFDHDLGENIQTGQDLAKYIEEKAFNNEISPIEWRVHSQNPSGAANIVNTMRSADRFWQRHQSLNKEAALDVKVISADSYGNLTILINEKKYQYKLPYTAEEKGLDIQKAKGKKLAKWIQWLDQYLINSQDRNDKELEEQMILPFPR